MQIVLMFKRKLHCVGCKHICKNVFQLFTVPIKCFPTLHAPPVCATRRKNPPLYFGSRNGHTSKVTYEVYSLGVPIHFGTGSRARAFFYFPCAAYVFTSSEFGKYRLHSLGRPISRVYRERRGCTRTHRRRQMWSQFKRQAIIISDSERNSLEPCTIRMCSR